MTNKEELIRAVRQDYMWGYKLAELSDKHGISKNQVRRWKKEFDWYGQRKDVLRRAKEEWEARKGEQTKLYNEIKDRHEKGERLCDLIREYKLNRHTVNKWAMRHKWDNTEVRKKYPKRTEYSQEIKDKVKEAYFTGMSLNDLAKEFNIKRNTVGVWITRGKWRSLRDMRIAA